MDISQLSQNKRHKKQQVVWLFIIGIIFTAMNLRAPLTSVGPLVGTIRADLHLSNTMAGAITTLPLLAFALFSPIVPRLGRKIGIELLILISLVFLTVGIVLRSLPGTASLYIGTAILGFAIAVCNVMIPGLIKRSFPLKIGIMTGVYSISMNLTGAIASGISIPIAVKSGIGWQGSLAIWGVLSFAALLLWLPQMKHNKREHEQTTTETQPDHQLSLWRSPLAWQVTMFMGIQSTVFYVLVAWLPEILKQQSISAEQSGWLLSIMQLALLPFTFIVPIIADRMKSQRPLVIITAILFLGGILGLLYGSPKLVLLWIIMLGIGIGFAFSLAMMFFGLRTENARQAAELSGMAQSVGYLLAAIGPALFGYLHDINSSWTVPLLLLAGLSVLLFVFGMGAAREGHVRSIRN